MAMNYAEIIFVPYGLADIWLDEASVFSW